MSQKLVDKTKDSRDEGKIGTPLLPTVSNSQSLGVRSSRMITLGKAIAPFPPKSPQLTLPPLQSSDKDISEGRANEGNGLTYSNEEILALHSPTSWIHPTFNIIPVITSSDSLEPVHFQPFDTHEIELAADADSLKRQNVTKRPINLHRHFPAVSHNTPFSSFPFSKSNNNQGSWKKKHSNEYSSHQGDKLNYLSSIDRENSQLNDIPEWANQDVQQIQYADCMPQDQISIRPGMESSRLNQPAKKKISMYDDFGGETDISPNDNSVFDRTGLTEDNIPHHSQVIQQQFYSNVKGGSNESKELYKFYDSKAVDQFYQGLFFQSHIPIHPYF